MRGMNLLYLSADHMGEGPDPELGRRLLRSFLARLVESDVRIDAVGCVNGAVFLTTEEGPALESLRALAAKGARVASCKTCLEHHGRLDRVLVGGVGTMEQSVALLATADRVIRP